MVIRHWHPLKLVIVWALGAALVWLLGTILLNGCDGCSLAIILSLVGLFLGTIVAVIVITWKWISGREPYGFATKNDTTQPIKADTEDLPHDNASTRKQYRVCKMKLPRSLLEQGFEFPPKISERYTLPEETETGGTIQEIEWEIEGWNLLSLFPLEKESDEEHVTVLALMERPYSMEIEEFLSRKYPYLGRT
ncbi:MAG: hypothetical protein HY348_13245 [Nitrospira defluvii]|nr:hypothetical protein [Nitrospira defluvii]